MVRSFLADPIPEDVLERVLAAALKAPSAGFTQAVELLVLDEPGTLSTFWGLVDPWGRKKPEGDRHPPVIVLPLTSEKAYRKRYSEPDKAHLGLGAEGREAEAGWPVPYWDVDAGMAAMMLMLAAVEEGLGSWFFGIFHGEADLMRILGVPGTHRPIGAIALGYPHPDDRPTGSSVSRPRRAAKEMIHRNLWSR